MLYEEPISSIRDKIIHLGRTFESRSLHKITSRIHRIAVLDRNESAEIVRKVLTMENDEVLAKKYNLPSLGEDDLPRKDDLPLLGRRHDLRLNVSPISGESFDLFAPLAIYQRRQGYDCTHGGFRIAVLFVRAEANALYPRLYSRQRPFAVMLVENAARLLPEELKFHNPDGRMATFASYISGLPFLLVGGGNPKCWHFYVKEDCEEDSGRELYRRLDRLSCL